MTITATSHGAAPGAPTLSARHFNLLTQLLNSMVTPAKPRAGASAGGNRHQVIAFLIMAGFFAIAPLVIYPVFLMKVMLFLMKVMCFALFACAFNLLIG